LSTVNLAF